jgi:hypothetical protein
LTKLKTAAEVLLLAIVAAFVAAIALGLFVDLFWSADKKPAEAFRGAFYGALFAFIFVRLGEALNRLYQAGKESRKALGLVQFNLNEALSITDDNIFVLQEWRRFYVAFTRRGGAEVPVFANHMERIPSSKDVFIDISNIGLVNELFSLESNIRKLNDSLETWEQAYQDAKKLFMTDQRTLATYIANTDRANAEVAGLETFLRALIDETMLALAAVRILLEDRPFLAKMYSWITPDRYVGPEHPIRLVELKKLQAEAQEISRESRKRINSLVGKK